MFVDTQERLIDIDGKPASSNPGYKRKVDISALLAALKKDSIADWAAMMLFIELKRVAEDPYIDQDPKWGTDLNSKRGIPGEGHAKGCNTD